MKPATKVYVVPARYAPEIEAAVNAAVRSILFEEKLRELGGANYTYCNVDESRAGNLMVLIAPITPEVAPVAKLDRQMTEEVGR